MPQVMTHARLPRLSAKAALWNTTTMPAPACCSQKTWMPGAKKKASISTPEHQAGTPFRNPDTHAGSAVPVRPACPHTCARACFRAYVPHCMHHLQPQQGAPVHPRPGPLGAVLGIQPPEQPAAILTQYQENDYESEQIQIALASPRAAGAA